jgi:formate hydrogenlyase transcriptional activator
MPPVSQLRVAPAQARLTQPRTLEDAARDHILQTLRDTNGVVGGQRGAAARLGLARTTLLSKMRRLGIEQPRTAEMNSFATQA